VRKWAVREQSRAERILFGTYAAILWTKGLPVKEFVMSDEPFYSPNRKPRPARQPRPGELLFEFRNSRMELVRCELRDHREFGVEVQFLANGDLRIGRTFRDDVLRGRARDRAIAWAERRRVMETAAQ
jgi:hypothetical protein